jgi:hypothetical protein
LKRQGKLQEAIDVYLILLGESYCREYVVEGESICPWWYAFLRRDALICFQDVVLLLSSDSYDMHVMEVDFLG